MHFIPDHVYHLYNRGNNKQRIFFTERNYQFFLEKIKTQLSPVCEIVCWCLMPYHFHLMVYVTQKSCCERASFGGKPMQELAYRIGILLSSYSQAINKQNGTTGSLFQQKTKAKCVSCLQSGCGDQSNLNAVSTNDNYLITCLHYIHQNPWKANLVNQLEDWKYSSFRQYIGKDNHLSCHHDLLRSLTGYQIDTFYQDSYGVLDKEVLKNIW